MLYSFVHFPSSSSHIKVLLSSFNLSVVHEKTILFPLLPMMLLTNQYPELTKWFVYYASYSMIPLYIKDINLIQAIALMFGYLILCPPQSFTKPIPCIGFVVSLVILCYYYMDPPLRYPDLHSVLISSFSCFVFCVFYCIMMVQQYRVVYHSELVEKKRDYFCLFPFIIILMNTLRIIPKLSIVGKSILLSFYWFSKEMFF